MLNIELPCCCCCLVTESCHFFETPWTVAHQSLCPRDFPYWSGLSFPSPGDILIPGIEPVFLALAGRFFISEPQEKPRATTWLNSSIPRCITKRISNIYPYKNLHINVSSSIIHNNQKNESNQSVHQFMNKKMRCGTSTPWNITQQLKKEWNTDKHYNTDESWNIILSKKVNPKRTHITWLHLYKMSKTSKSCLRLGVEEKRAVMANRYRILFRDVEII